MIQAIETWYAGCKFRSRLEARWAVFFDALDIEWQYEPQGWVLSNGTTYLPDFWLPAQQVWAEVKAKPSLDAAITTFHAAADLPGSVNGQQLLLLGQFPYVKTGWTCWQHSLAFDVVNQIVHTQLFAFTPGGLVRMEATGIPVLDAPLVESDVAASVWQWDAFVMDNGQLPPLDIEGFQLDQRTTHAYIKARSARFEHGESGPVF